jgi:hypothetical protein
MSVRISVHWPGNFLLRVCCFQEKFCSGCVHREQIVLITAINIPDVGDTIVKVNVHFYAEKFTFKNAKSVQLPAAVHAIVLYALVAVFSEI